MKRFRKGPLVAICALAVTAPQAAFAQDNDILVEPELLVDYDRSRNIAVTEKRRPDYDALGIRASSFLVYPRLDIGLGYNDNIFLADSDEVSDGYAIIRPSVRAQSDWSRHQLTATASGAFRRFFDNSVRDEDSWNVGALGRVDATSALTLTAQVQAGNRFESAFSGGVDANVAALSNYDYNFLSLRGRYELGRNRIALAYNRNEYDFNNIRFSDSTTLDQSNRSRTIDSIVGQFERALNPGLSVYGQLSYARTRYDALLAPGVENRDSDGYRAVAGVSMDLPAFIRGTLASGYTWRNFDSPLFRQVKGLSVDAKLEYFPSELTTFTLRGSRLIQDSNIAITTAFFDNRISLGVDHELLRNVILSASGDLSYQDYIGSPNNSTVYRLSSRARYLMSRKLSADLLASYAHRNRETLVSNGNLSEMRIEATVSLRL
ncbi:hypothetical protein BF95_10620 [Sphingobium sp. Ant17]|nr:hypothetical protein BF95_10620 [Sphingobium sp. Ant17]